MISVHRMFSKLSIAMSLRLRRSTHPGAWRQIPRGDLAGVRRDVQAPQRRDGARDLGLSQEGHDAKHRQAAVVDLRAQPGKPRIRRNRNDSCTAKDDKSSGKRCAESEKKRSTILKIQRILFEDTPRVTSPPSTRPTCSSAS